jgi:inosose dehydratase
MTTSQYLPRRRFLRASLLGSAALAGGAIPSLSLAAVTKAEREPFDGLKVGVASYSLRNFKLDQAIAITKTLGVKYIALKDMHLPLTSTTDERREARKKINEAGLTLMGAGVISMNNNEEEIRRAFEYAKDAGIPTIVCMPNRNAIDTLEKVAKEYDIRAAIHNHGPGDKNFPSPSDAFSAIKDRDSRLGLCIDIGHTVRIGEDPTVAIKKYASRLYDLHIKDVTAAKPEGNTTAMGRGVIDLVAVVKVLLEIKFPYHAALEYEAHPEDPLPGMMESFAYLRGILAAVG